MNEKISFHFTSMMARHAKILIFSLSHLLLSQFTQIKRIFWLKCLMVFNDEEVSHKIEDERFSSILVTCYTDSWFTYIERRWSLNRKENFFLILKIMFLPLFQSKSSTKKFENHYFPATWSFDEWKSRWWWLSYCGDENWLNIFYLKFIVV